MDTGADGEPRDRLAAYNERAVVRGVNRALYWPVRSILVPFFLLYFQMSRIGRQHLARHGPLLIASNHRSFLDPFLIGTLTRRPVYYMAKRELFAYPVIAWLLSSLGAFPVDRGAGDTKAIDTARAILARGDCVVLFPEGTRVRPGPLGRPRRGVGRLALETGAPVAPIAVIGTEDVRRGWRIRPRRVSLRVGAPMRFPSTDQPSPAAARTVTARIWTCVSLQWEWLGGEPSLRPEARRASSATPARRRRAPLSPSSREKVHVA